MQFGVPLYGGTLSGSVIHLPDNALGCKEFGQPLPTTGTLPTVLLVDRGGERWLAVVLVALV